MAEVTFEGLLKLIDKEGGIKDTRTLASANGWEHDKLVGVVKSLQAEGLVDTEALKGEGWKLTEEGEQYSKAGSPEAQVFNHIKSTGKGSKDAINEALGKAGQVGVSVAMKNKWLTAGKDGFTLACDSITDTVQADLLVIDTLPPEKLQAYKKRNLVTTYSLTGFRVNKTSEFSVEFKKASADLTADMLKSNAWQKENLKPFNFKDVCGLPCGGGSLHPLMKVRSELRNVLLLMGFEEMPTNQWVESSFWNFDSLFQPQQHPARDAHDTFFMATPSRAQNLPEAYLEDVKNMHSRGGRGSTGWQYDWSEDEAKKNLLRTHTTAVSARTLYKLAQEYKETGVFKPRKFFSIDRVFRNETLDATHLAEFHQVEGFVADRNLGLGHLIGIIREFFLRLGVTGLRFKPAYNPYTEPSMEIFGWHPLLKKTVELGNSGVFRPEMLLPMGLPEDVTVIAWGIGVERTAARMYNIRAIKELFSHQQDTVETKKKGVCWLTRAEE
mmetsp:Transcript_21576/g.50316  ORF Transcript_21576/g.50316 Transcript_21576/m.50316 type:complete len:497 (-) Transcript_21576:103-1593(-)